MTIAQGQSLDLFIEAVLGKKAFDVVALDVSELTSIAETFILCSGRSDRQVSAIAEHIQQTLKAHRIMPLHVEGKQEGHWVLLDYGHVVIHVFYEPVREFYDLESLWTEAPRIDLNPWNPQERPEAPPDETET